MGNSCEICGKYEQIQDYKSKIFMTCEECKLRKTCCLCNQIPYIKKDNKLYCIYHWNNEFYV